MPLSALRRQIAWIANHWRPYGSQVPLLLALTLANTALLVVCPVYLKRIVDGIVAARRGRDPFTTAFNRR